MCVIPYFLTQVSSTLSTDTWDETTANFSFWGMEVSFTHYVLTEPSSFMPLGAPCFPGMLELQLTDPQRHNHSEIAAIVTTSLKVLKIFYFFFYHFFLNFTNQPQFPLPPLLQLPHPTSLLPIPYPLFFCLHSEGARPPMGINRAWHNKLRQNQAPPPLLQG